MYATLAKPALDRCASLLLIILLATPLAIVALCILLDSRGPIFFRQRRYGRNRVPFTVYKFRTMYINAPKNIPTNSFKNANAYITRTGKIMRKLSIDELPQIINVLRGDMSIVGPRPVVLTETGLIELREQYGANGVKPGITGWAQVNGRDELSDIAKSRMDGYYIEKLGIATDVKCLLKTVWVIASAAGHAEGHEKALDDSSTLKAVGND